MTPDENYISLMETIRGRLDVITQLKQSTADDFAKAEAAAFQGRKVIEGTAFACLVAIENGLPAVPKDAKGKWNAEDILRSLKKKGLDVLPSPSVFREATPEEKQNQGATKATLKRVDEGCATRKGSDLTRRCSEPRDSAICVL